MRVLHPPTGTRVLTVAAGLVVVLVAWYLLAPAPTMAAHNAHMDVMPTTQPPASASDVHNRQRRRRGPRRGAEAARGRRGLLRMPPRETPAPPGVGSDRCPPVVRRSVSTGGPCRRLPGDGAGG